MRGRSIPHLRALEAESIHILREVVAEFARPVMLYSIGKDSSVMLRLAQKAFYPGRLPFPLLHIDTTYKFREMIEFRDRCAREVGAELIVHTNRTAIESGANPFALGTQKCCAQLKTKALLDALTEGGFDAAFGGARREEEKSRAKERVYSFRDSLGQWDPKNQRPELWNLYNGRIEKGETIRVFPLSNWTELDVWHYIHLERIPVVPLYFARARVVLVRNGTLLPLEHDPPRLNRRETAERWSAGCARWGAPTAPGPCAATPIRSPRLLRNCWRPAARSGRTASSITTRKARWS
jgi:sulfate adenylyltransferase subunit 2